MPWLRSCARSRPLIRWDEVALHPGQVEEPAAIEAADGVEDTVADHDPRHDDREHDIPLQGGVFVPDQDARGDDRKLFRDRKAEAGRDQGEEDSLVAIFVEVL